MAGGRRGEQEEFAREKLAIYVAPEVLGPVVTNLLAGVPRSCVVGDPGVGKSAAMAHAAERARRECPGACVIAYAAGVAMAAGDWGP